MRNSALNRDIGDPVDPHAPCIVYVYRPGQIYLNITNRCTNACAFCSVRLNHGWLGPINLNLAGIDRVPLRVHPKDPLALCQSPGECEIVGFQNALDAEPNAERILFHLAPFLSRKAYPISEVVFCGAGEPLIRLETVLQVSKVLKEQDVRVRVNTNGHAGLVHGPDTVERLSIWVDEVSISLNAKDALSYVTICRPSAGAEAYEALLDFASQCVKHLSRVTLSIVRPGLEVERAIDEEACRKIATKIGARFRLR